MKRCAGKRNKTQRVSKMVKDVIAIGELLIDFTPGGTPQAYVAHPGGAPANFLVQLARLGRSTAFMGMVGDDAFGRQLRQTLEKEHVDVQSLKRHPEIPTTLAFVHIDAAGDRSFTFYRHPGADMLFTVQDIDRKAIENARLFHFGGVSLSREPMREATMEAARYARSLGKTITFDPNYRAMLWNSREEAADCIRQAIALCNMLKISDEEALMVTGESDMDKAAQKLEEMGPAWVFVTLGPEGCLYRVNGRTGFVPTYDTAVVDTTGAGDSFFGALMSRWLDRGGVTTAWDDEGLKELVAYANAAGATTASGYGAISSLPTHDEICGCMASAKTLHTTRP